VFGRAVRAIRDEKGISQEELAHRSGVDRSYMGGIERGERNPSLKNIFRIAEGLDVPAHVLFERFEEISRSDPRQRG
jgi:transcriptional regulator with XRE-family HTH domain